MLSRDNQPAYVSYNTKLIVKKHYKIILKWEGLPEPTKKDKVVKEFEKIFY